ncbi:hypothetical protein V8E36_009772 [Tilletia maclaganii]
MKSCGPPSSRARSRPSMKRGRTSTVSPPKPLRRPKTKTCPSASAVEWLEHQLEQLRRHRHHATANDLVIRFEKAKPFLRHTSIHIVRGLGELAESAVRAFKRPGLKKSIPAIVERLLKFYEDIIGRGAKVLGALNQGPGTKVNIALHHLFTIALDFNRQARRPPGPKRQEAAMYKYFIRKTRALLKPAIQRTRRMISLGRNRRILAQSVRPRCFDSSMVKSFTNRLWEIKNDYSTIYLLTQSPTFPKLSYQAFCDSIAGLDFGSSTSISLRQAALDPNQHNRRLGRACLLIAHECDPQTLAFDGDGGLEQWRETARVFVVQVLNAMMDRRDCLNSLPFSVNAFLTYLIIQLVKLGAYEHAASVAEYLARSTRWTYKTVPTARNACNLVHSLNILAFTLNGCCKTDFRRVEALRVTKQAIRLAEAMRNDHPDEAEAMVAACHQTRAHVDLEPLHQGEGVQITVATAIRACKSANIALEASRLDMRRRPSDHTVQARHALALYTAALAHWALLNEIAGNAYDCPFDYKCLYELGHQHDGSEPCFHDLARDWGLGTLDDAARNAAEAIRVITELPLHSALLLPALELCGELNASRPVRAAIYLKAALQQVDAREERFEKTPITTRTNIALRLALHLRRTGCYDTAPRDVRKYLLRLEEPTEHPTLDADGRLTLQASLVLAVAQMERYDEALACAGQVGYMKPQVGGDSAPFTMEAVWAYCRWLAGSADDNLASLQSALGHSAEAMSHYHEKSTAYMLQSATHFLILGWLGGVKAALGQTEEALTDGQDAVSRLGTLLVDFAGRTEMDSSMTVSSKRFWDWNVTDHALVPVDQILPQLLVLLAATLTQVNRLDSATTTVDEALAIIDEGGKADLSTTKTALVLKANLLERCDRVAEAAEVRTRAEAVPRRGYLHRLGCWRATKS